MKNKNKKKQVTRAPAYKGKVTLFFASLAVFSIIGFCWFWRPEVSEIEKRELTEFPVFTVQNVMDGSALRQLDLWYADTYPLRELLIAGNHAVQSLYGDRSQQLVDDGQRGDEIPDIDPSAAPATLPPRPTPTPTPVPTPTPAPTPTAEPSPTPAPSAELTTPAPTPTPSPTPTATPTPTAVPEPSPEQHQPVEHIGSVYVQDGCGYGLFRFSTKNVNHYAAVLNELGEQLNGTANLYCLVAPISSGVMLDEETYFSLGGSDQRRAVEYCFSLMSGKVKPVRVIDAMRQHRDEYLYFRSDHHWTQTGAYYAYREFAAAAGLVPHELSQFESIEFPGFLGTFYASTQSAAMRSNPDCIKAYYPMGTNRMTMTTREGLVRDWKIIQNVSKWKSAAKYNCFCGSDNPYSEIHNPAITDGSSCLVVKDSYANAFIPFLVDHYEHVYWIDFRAYKGNIADLAKEKNVQNVLILSNIYNMGSKNAVNLLETRVVR